MDKNIIDELFSITEDFLVKLRTGEGFSEEKYKKLCVVLQKCNIEWLDKSFIPKNLANVLVDLYPAIESCSYFYSEEEAERIRKASDEIADFTRLIVSE